MDNGTLERPPIHTNHLSTIHDGHVQYVDEIFKRVESKGIEKTKKTSNFCIVSAINNLFIDLSSFFHVIWRSSQPDYMMF